MAAVPVKSDAGRRKCVGADEGSSVGLDVDGWVRLGWVHARSSTVCKTAHGS